MNQTKAKSYKILLVGIRFLVRLHRVGRCGFLLKVSLKQMNPYEIDFLMAIGALVTAVRRCV